MRIIFAGTPENAADSLQSLHDAGLDVVCVITRTDAAFGRKRELSPSPVALKATELGLKTIKTNEFDEETLSELSNLKADLGIVVAFGAFLKKDALELVPRGWVNLHYSLLPKYRGAAPVQHAILNGEATTGVTVFQLDEGMDTGPILLSVPTRIETGENSKRLLERLTQLGITALLEVIPAIAAGIVKPQTQSTDGASFAPKLSRQNAKLDWNDTANKLENFINAMNPEPMAWTSNGSSVLRVLSAREFTESNLALKHGAVTQKDGTVIVGCKDSSLELLVVQPAGKSQMSAKDWYNGVQEKDSIVFAE